MNKVTRLSMSYKKNSCLRMKSWEITTSKKIMEEEEEFIENTEDPEPQNENPKDVGSPDGNSVVCRRKSSAQQRLQTPFMFGSEMVISAITVQCQETGGGHESGQYEANSGSHHDPESCLHVSLAFMKSS